MLAQSCRHTYCVYALVELLLISVIIPLYELGLFTPQLAGEAPPAKIVLDHVRIYMYTPQCLSTRCIGGTSIGDVLVLATKIQAPDDPCKLMNIAIQTNCIKH